jgi:shikimate kinase
MNLILIGFMASGTTSVGRRLAQRLAYGFIDTDQFIESEIGCTISEIFSIQGEAYFRELETRLAHRLPKLENTVIATGGGMIITPGNHERLREAGTIIFLKARKEDIMERLERDTRRPKAREGDDLETTVSNLMAERLPVYEQADIVIESGGKSVNRVCGEIIRELSKIKASETKASEATASETITSEHDASEPTASGTTGSETTGSKTMATKPTASDS